MFTVSTCNVNGIRAATRKGLLEWVAATSPDVLALQEVRAPAGMVAEILGEGWHVLHDAGMIPGRAGVALASRVPFAAVRSGLGSDLPADSGRWVEAEVVTAGGPVTVVSTYVHSGQADSPRQAVKYAFLDRMTERLAELSAGEVVVLGDFNIAHREVDLKSFKTNLRNAGFLTEERAYLDRWFSSGLVDVGRALAGPGPGPYTWWSQRGKAFDNDAGWRIDYHIASPGVAARARSFRIDRAPSWDTRWSDHAPLTVTYNL